MNHVNSLASHVDAPMPRTRSVRRFFAALKKFICSAEELPTLTGPERFAPAYDRVWAVKGRLTQETSFGTVFTESAFLVRAETEPAALQAATSTLRQTHPAFRIATLRAEREFAN